MDSLKEKVRVRNAAQEDISFVAECVLAAVGMYDFGQRPEEFEKVLALCAMDDTLYSYRNAIIATLDSLPIGCLICYPGGGYAAARERTFAQIPVSADSDMETGPGEYYLDSLAVIPSYRGQGIGKFLLRAGIAKGKELGFKKVTLIVDKTHPKVKAYYSSLGFEDGKGLRFFGDDYIKMILNI